MLDTGTTKAATGASSRLPDVRPPHRPPSRLPAAQAGETRWADARRPAQHSRTNRRRWLPSWVTALGNQGAVHNAARAIHDHQAAVLAVDQQLEAMRATTRALTPRDAATGTFAPTAGAERRSTMAPDAAPAKATGQPGRRRP